MSKKPTTSVTASRESKDSREVQANYISDGVEVTVKSKFIGESSLEDLFFEIISRKLTNNDHAVLYCKDSQPAACVPLMGGN